MIWNLEMCCVLGDMAKRIRPGIAIGCRIRGGAYAQRVNDDGEIRLYFGCSLIMFHSFHEYKILFFFIQITG